MPFFKKKTGKHHVKQPDGSTKTYYPGDIIECEPEFLGGALNTFEKVDNPNPAPARATKVSVAVQEIVDEVVEEEEPVAKEVKKKKVSRFKKG